MIMWHRNMPACHHVCMTAGAEATPKSTPNKTSADEVLGHMTAHDAADEDEAFEKHQHRVAARKGKKRTTPPKTPQTPKTSAQKPPLKKKKKTCVRVRDADSQSSSQALELSFSNDSQPQDQPSEDEEVSHIT